MAQVVTVERFKRGFLILLAAALVFAGSLSIQGAQAQERPDPGDFDEYELLIMSLQIDFVCSSNYTGIDRIGKSIPVIQLFQELDAGVFDTSAFQSPCRSYETGRITFSFNPTIFMQLFNQPGAAGR